MQKCKTPGADIAAKARLHSDGERPETSHVVGLRADIGILERWNLPIRNGTTRARVESSSWSYAS